MKRAGPFDSNSTEYSVSTGRSFLVVLLAVGVCLPAAAQRVDASIRGTLIDPSGNPAASGFGRRRHCRRLLIWNESTRSASATKSRDALANRYSLLLVQQVALALPPRTQCWRRAGALTSGLLVVVGAGS